MCHSALQQRLLTHRPQCAQCMLRCSMAGNVARAVPVTCAAGERAHLPPCLAQRSLHVQLLPAAIDTVSTCATQAACSACWCNVQVAPRELDGSRSRAGLHGTAQAARTFEGDEPELVQHEQ